MSTTLADRHEIQQNIQEILRRTFKNESLIITDETSADDVDGWDSLSHIFLLSEIEKFFEFRFTFNEVLSFENIGQLINCIYSKKAN
jgi:acyl carrier protein